MLLRARSSRLFRFHRWYDRHMYRPLFWYTARDLHAGSVHIFVPDRLSHIGHCINLSNARITAMLTALSERSDGRQRCRWCCENGPCRQPSERCGIGQPCHRVGTDDRREEDERETQRRTMRDGMTCCACSPASSGAAGCPAAGTWKATAVAPCRKERRITGEVSIMTRHLPENDAPRDEPDLHSGQSGPDSGGQSGDTQGVSQAADAAEESVEELTGAGQDYEAQILKGVEDATDHRVKPVPNHGD